jgi:hypothetical protein
MRLAAEGVEPVAGVPGNGQRGDHERDRDHRHGDLRTITPHDHIAFRQ